MLEILLAASLLGLTKAVLVAALAALNAFLSLVATLAIWNTYLVMGTKVLWTVLVCIPVLGIVLYLVWGRKKVEEAQ
jgi:hypothetical protein